MQKQEPSAVEEAVTELTAKLGVGAGVEEEETNFVMPDGTAKRLEKGHVGKAFAPALKKVQEEAWWKKAGKPEDSAAPLRAVASVLEGCVAAEQASCVDPETLRAEAKSAAEYLMKAQKDGGKGCFPFPAWRGKMGRLGQIAEKFLKKAESDGKLAEVTSKGWIVDDLGGGDLLFDNGLAGTALLHFHEHTGNAEALASAKAAGDWAMGRPVVPNWNYNSFSVGLLAELHRVTKEPKYLDAAKRIAAVGILPGQLQSGKYEGRWIDPHNARFVYHYIILRGLILLYLQLPTDDPLREKVNNALLAGLIVRNTEIIELGMAHPETTMDVFTLMLENREALADLIGVTQTEAAANLTFRGVMEEVVNDHPTIPPGAWGKYLRLTAKGAD
jgi:hypothetical protein